MSEMGNITIRITARDEATEKLLRVTGTLEELGAASKETAAVSKETASAVGAVGDEAKKTAENVNTADKATKAIAKSGKKWIETGSGIKAVGEGIDSVTKPLQYAAIGTVALGVAAGKAAADYETAFTGVRKTVDGTDAELEAVDKGIKELSETVPTSAAELANLAAVGGQLGIKTKDIVKFTKTMTDMGASTNLAGEEGAAAMARFLNVMNEDTDNIDRVGSAIVDLGNHTATTEADIMYMAQRMGKFGNTVGMSTPQVLAYSAALSSMGIEAQLGGSAIGRVWYEIQSAVSAGGEDLAGFASMSGKSAAEFKKQWGEDASGAFLSLINGIRESGDTVVSLKKLGFENVQDQQALTALVNGYDLLTECLTRADTAYEENVALSNEANAAYDTTANKIKIAMNSVTNAGIAWGNVLLPEVSKGAEAIGAFGEKLGNMSDSSKSVVLYMGKMAVATGVLTKVTSSGLKSVGGIVESVGKFKKLAAGGGTAAKLISYVPMLGKLGLAVGTVVTAVKLGQAAYGAWYDSQYRWSKGLSEGNEKISESMEKFKSLSEVQSQIKDLKLVIENPESSKEQVDEAKSKLDEIREMLSEEYNLVINSDNSNLEDVVDTVTQYTENELRSKFNTQQQKLNSLASKANPDNWKITAEDVQNAQDAMVKYQSIRVQLETLGYDMQAGKISQADYINRLTEYGEQLGYTEREIEQIRNQEIVLSDLMSRATAGEESTADTYNRLNQKYNDLLAAYNEYRAISTEMANWSVEAIGLNVKQGDAEGVEKYLQHLSELVKNAELDISGYAQAAATALNGIDFTAAIKNGGAALENFASDYIGIMQRFGVSGEEASAMFTAAFTTIGQSLGMSEEEIAAVIDSILEKLNSIPPEKSVTINAEDNASSVISTVSSQITTLDGKTATVYIRTQGESNLNKYYTGGYIPAEENAKGTQNFGGGLAMVNDETGISDNRELIIDRGRAFIPEGRNVILPLSKGAKVYTARQTKRMMAAMGIPRYADGKDNSDAFTEARDNWNHYTRTHAVTTAEELAKWVEFSQQFTDNLKDAEDIEEEIFSLTVKQNEKLNELSEKYIENRNFHNDWEEYGDSFEAAYKRLEERNRAAVTEGKLTAEEYTEYMTSAGEKMYDDRADTSLRWLEHEEKYNSMLEADYIEGLKRMQRYTLQAYEAGIIDFEKYREEMSDISDKILDKTAEANKNEFSNWKNDAETWENMRDTFDDWEEYGDSKIKYYNRYAAKVKSFYSQGKISFEEYIAELNDVAMKKYNEYGNGFDEAMQRFANAISGKRDEFSKQEQALQDSWTVSDRETNIDDLKRQIAIYEKSVTKSGQDKLKSLQEQLRDEERQQELYEMQKEHTEILEELQAKYDYMEDNKTALLHSMSAGMVDTLGMAEQIEATVKAANDIAAYAVTDVYSVLTDIYSAVRGMNTNSYTDSRNINIRTGASTSDVLRAINSGITPSMLFGGKRY